MGWNAGYRIFEETVVGAYDLGKLDKDLLRVFMEPYRGSDIDSGGSQDLESKDGLNVEEIVVKTWGGEVPVRPDLPESPAKWTPEQDDAYGDYREELGAAFNAITDEFDWY